MKWHTIFAKVDKGLGDYGGDTKCLFDGLASRDNAIKAASEFAVQLRTQVDLFAGKRIGRFVATFQRKGVV